MSADFEPSHSAESHEVPNEECEARVSRLQELVGHLSIANTDTPSAAEVVHEVAQPVTAATNFLAVAEQLLSREGVEAQEGGLEAVRNARECLARTADVMASARHATGAKAFDPSPQNLGGIVADALQMFEFDGKILPLIEIASDAARVMGDGGQLVQVVCNLVRNAAEATEGQAARRLRIASRRIDADNIELRIEDNGPGIADEMRGLLFASFSSTKTEGTGVGLSISRAIIEQHQGRIWADALPDGGTAFCFVVPACAVPGFESLKESA
jgi:two-component system, LuxR family, sensor kinase FixL